MFVKAAKYFRKQAKQKQLAFSFQKISNPGQLHDHLLPLLLAAGKDEDEMQETRVSHLSTIFLFLLLPLICNIFAHVKVSSICNICASPKVSLICEIFVSVKVSLICDFLFLSEYLVCKFAQWSHILLLNHFLLFFFCLFLLLAARAGMLVATRSN